LATKDTPQGIVGFKFASALLGHYYDDARGLLSPQLREKYSSESLKKTFEKMMSLADEPSDIDEIEVLDNALLGAASLDDDGWAYIAIWTEAITITAKQFGFDYFISDVVWGRP
jgi:hypothetical protein